jgi:hypothetical protein
MNLPNDAKPRLAIRELSLLLRMNEKHPNPIRRRSDSALRALVAYGLAHPVPEQRISWKLTPQGRALALAYLGDGGVER